MPIDLAFATALATARAIADGELSALEACDRAIARIEACDRPINAVVVRDFDRARDQARARDADRSKGVRKALLGVPMTVKESNDVSGLPTTWGFAPFGTIQVAEDAVAVQRLKAAGAVILGKTNVAPMLADWQSANSIYGRTNNPHHLARTAGGSSGGAAAAVARGMVPLELGSDIGGSIRVPAHFCGVFGLKPSYGVVPLRGHALPGTDSVDVPLAVVGPLARDADDLSAAFDAIAGPAHPTGWRLALPAARRDSLAAQRVLVLVAHPSCRTSSAVADAVNRLAADVRRAGAQVTTKHEALPDLAAAHADYLTMLNTVILRGAASAKPIDAHRWFDIVDAQMRVRRRWRAVFETVDVLIAPAFGSVAFPHIDEPDWSKRTHVIDGEPTPYGAQLAWPGLASFPGLPAVAAPVGKDDDGLPIGVQIVAGPYEDRTALAFAAQLQRAGLACTARPAD